MPSRKELLVRRFGLIMSPTPDQIRHWEDQADELMRAGRTFDNACDLAAPIAFQACGLGQQDLSVPARYLWGEQPRVSS